MIISECTLLCGEETYNDMEDFGEAKEDQISVKRRFLC